MISDIMYFFARFHQLRSGTQNATEKTGFPPTFKVLDISRLLFDLLRSKRKCYWNIWINCLKILMSVAAEQWNSSLSTRKKLTLVRGGNFANWIKNQFEKASFNVAVGKGHNEMHRERAIGKLVWLGHGDIGNIPLVKMPQCKPSYFSCPMN